MGKLDKKRLIHWFEIVERVQNRWGFYHTLENGHQKVTCPTHWAMTGQDNKVISKQIRKKPIGVVFS